MTCRSVCIITPAYLSSTPRVVKEADALWNAGFRVRVVFGQGDLEDVRRHDDQLLSARKWSWTVVGWARRRPAERFTYWRATLRHLIARQLPPPLWSFGRLPEQAEERIYPELARSAADTRADLFIGHYPAGLAAAAYAASVWQAKLGYDAEDFHAGEQPSSPAQRQARVDRIERAHLGRCSQLTASSPEIAEALARRYGIPKPLPIHNVFPWADRAVVDAQQLDRRGPGLSLYWYSQTIGLDRGIQDAIRAVGLLDKPVQIHLRGNVSESTRAELGVLAHECHLEGRLHFHAPVPPTGLLSRAAEHDVGLALEQPVDVNKGLTASNKLFLYLLAGLAVVATDLPGQRSVLATCPAAGHLYTPGDYPGLAEKIAAWCADPNALRAARTAALTAAQTMWNWEHESQKLIESVRKVLP